MGVWYRTLDNRMHQIGLKIMDMTGVGHFTKQMDMTGVGHFTTEWTRLV